MRYTNPWDRFGVLIRPLAIGTFVLFGPVALYVYAKAISEFIIGLPFWLGVIAGISQASFFLTVAALFDTRREIERLQDRDRDALHPEP